MINTSTIRIGLLASVCCVQMMVAQAQDKKIDFNGVGRALITTGNYEGELQKVDTITPNRESQGHTLIDLRADIFPNKETEISAIMRFSNQFGGFWGSGANVQLRQLFARGVVADKLRYRVGDMYLQQTKYTLFNSDAETATRFEPAAFSLYDDFINYENYYVDNQWRLQGGSMDFALQSESVIKEVAFSGFLSANPGSIFFGNLKRLYGGGRVQVDQSENLKFGLNYVNMFDLLGTATDSAQYVNAVSTFDFNYKREINSNLLLLVEGELGNSRQVYNTSDTLAPAEVKDFFFDFGASVKLPKKGLNVGVTYRNVGAGFTSAGAQTRRVDYGMQGANFGIIHPNDLPEIRQARSVDINRDTSIYNRALQSELMAYNTRYTLLNPYGRATPNRKGLTFAVDYNHPKKLLDAYAQFELLSEVVGEGTSNKRKFTGIEAGTQFHIHELIDWKKIIDVSASVYLQSSSRAQEDSAAAVDYNTMLLDLGAAVEIIDKLDLLLGLKVITASGTEYSRVATAPYLEVTDYPVYSLDDQEQLSALGLRYRFKENVSLSVQGQFFTFQDNVTAQRSYNMNQLLFFYNMNF